MYFVNAGAIAGIIVGVVLLILLVVVVFCILRRQVTYVVWTLFT